MNRIQGQSSGRILWIDYLRSFITILVVAHHSTLAYTTFSRINENAYILSTHPIIDRKRWVGLDIFENFNDVFFMSLMFLIGGIFVIKSLQKKDAHAFIRDRFYRLFIPFAVAVSSIMLIGYYAAYLNMHPYATLRGFLHDFFFIEGWPPGPPWFIWVLFLFNLIFGMFSKPAVAFSMEAGRILNSWKDKPLTVVLVFYSLIWILYVPASWILGPYSWKSFGPFAFQESRLLLYFGFFVCGAILGTSDIHTGLFSPDSRFMKKWPLWLGLCFLFYLMLVGLEALGREGVGEKLGEWPSKIIYGFVYAGSNCFSCLAFLTVFRQFILHSNKVCDSITANAYCIYLVHYIFVLWSQYYLLNMELPALIKFLITFIIAFGVSWIISIQLRKIPLIKKYV